MPLSARFFVARAKEKRKFNMAGEEKNTEQTATEESSEKTGFDKFNETMDKIETEQQEAATATAEPELEPEKDESSTEDETVGEDVVSTDEVSAETELSAEKSEILKGIDPDVLDVCREKFDDDQIVEIAQRNPELLADIRAELDAYEEPTVKPAEKGVEKPAEKEAEKKAEFEEIKLNLDENIVGADVKNAIDTMVAKLNAFGKNLNEQSKGLTEEQSRLQSERYAAYNNRIDGCFDKQAKILASESKKAGEAKPIIDLGDSSQFVGKQFNQLNRQQRQQVSLRTEIFRHAQVTSEIRNIPIEKAIEIEVGRYKNQTGEKVAEQRLLNKMERSRKRHTNPPTRRHSVSDIKSRKYATEAERITALMDEAHRQAGDED